MKLKGDVFDVGQGVERLELVFQKGHHIALNFIHGQAAAFQFGQVEHLVDQVEQMLSVVLDAFQLLPYLVFNLWLQLAGDAFDDGEWGAEFMGDVGVQAVFDGVELPQPTGFGLGQLAGQLEAIESVQAAGQQGRPQGVGPPGAIPGRTDGETVLKRFAPGLGLADGPDFESERAKGQVAEFDLAFFGGGAPSFVQAF